MKIAENASCHLNTFKTLVGILSSNDFVYSYVFNRCFLLYSCVLYIFHVTKKHFSNRVVTKNFVCNCNNRGTVAIKWTMTCIYLIV